MDHRRGVEHGGPRPDARRTGGRRWRGRARRPRRRRPRATRAPAGAARRRSGTRQRMRSRWAARARTRFWPSQPAAPVTTAVEAGSDMGTSAASVSVTGTCRDRGAERQVSARNWSQLRVAMAMIAACGLTPGASGMSDPSFTRRLPVPPHPTEAVGSGAPAILAHAHARREMHGHQVGARPGHLVPPGAELVDLADDGAADHRGVQLGGARPRGASRRGARGRGPGG